MVEFLVANGADVDRAESRSKTPLYVACEQHHVDAKSIIDMWYAKLGEEAWRASAGHCFGAGSHQAIWYGKDKAMHDAALDEIGAGEEGWSMVGALVDGWSR